MGMDEKLKQMLNPFFGVQNRSEVEPGVDFVKVVRCKDCIHGKQLFADYVSCGISEENESGCHVSHKPDWFCADGERKEGR